MADGITDGQLATFVTILGAGLTALGVGVRWSAGIVRDAFKENRDAIAQLRSESTQVIRDNTAAFAKLTEWLGRIDVRTEESTRRVVEVHHEISGVHDKPSVEDLEPTSNGTGRELDDEEETPVDRPRSVGRSTPARGVGAYHKKKA